MMFILIKQVSSGSEITNKAQEFTRKLISNYNLTAICIFSNQFERKPGYIKPRN